MKNAVVGWFRRQSFSPSRWAILVNPLYISRRGIFDGVRSNAGHMTGRMLDFGCGGRPYEGHVPCNQYVGLDLYSPDEAGPDKPKADVLYDGSAIPFASESFDSVLSSEVLEHVVDLDAVLSEILRVLRPGGALLVTTPFVWNEHEVPFDFRRFTSFGLKQTLEHHGFEVEEFERSSSHIEALVQTWNAYLFNAVLPGHGIVRYAFVPILIAPTALLSRVLARVMPDTQRFYLTNIILARRPSGN